MYEDWINSLTQGKDENYYDNIVKYAKEITQDLNKYKDSAMLKRLNIKHQPVLSHLKPLIFAIARA